MSGPYHVGTRNGQTGHVFKPGAETPAGWRHGDIAIEPMVNVLVGNRIVGGFHDEALARRVVDLLNTSEVIRDVFFGDAIPEVQHETGATAGDDP